MLVREIMTAPAIDIRSDADVDEAIELLAGRRITLLPVVDEKRHLVGVISEVDVLRAVVQPDGRAHMTPAGEQAPAPLHITDLMTTEARTTTESTDVADLVRVFVDTSVKSLPVVRGEELIGIISRSDIIRALWRSDEDVLDDLVGAFADYGQQDWKIAVEHGCVTISGSGSARDRNVATAIARSILGVRDVRVVVND